MKRHSLLGVALGGVLLAGATFANHSHHSHVNPNFDARISLEKSAAAVKPTAAQKSAAQRLQAEVQDLSIEYSAQTGVSPPPAMSSICSSEKPCFSSS